MTKINPSKLGAVEQFCEAAKRLSFTAAAKSLGTTPSSISKSVGRLEDQLGVKLFQRSTRSIRLTDEGRDYYETWQQALTHIEDVEESLGIGRIGSIVGPVLGGILIQRQWTNSEIFIAVAVPAAISALMLFFMSRGPQLDAHGVAPVMGH